LNEIDAASEPHESCAKPDSFGIDSY